MIKEGPEAQPFKSAATAACGLARCLFRLRPKPSLLLPLHQATWLLTAWPQLSGLLPKPGNIRHCFFIPRAASCPRQTPKAHEDAPPPPEVSSAPGESCPHPSSKRYRCSSWWRSCDGFVPPERRSSARQAGFSTRCVAISPVSPVFYQKARSSVREHN